jgi:Reverse transcriptase (RNA-dependent DNA polymerase).
MPGCSTTQKILRLTEAISSGLDRKWSTVAVFLDISKPCNTTWHMGLLYKLTHMGLPGELITVIDSYLAHRSFRVRMDGALSAWKPMFAGVPQDSTLSPMLYNLYTSDIAKSIRTELAVHADDICIYDQQKNVGFAHLAVQRHLNVIGRWAADWRINISAQKTKAVFFSKKTRL